MTEISIYICKNTHSYHTNTRLKFKPSVQVVPQAVSPKVPLSPRQVSCGPVARRHDRVATGVSQIWPPKKRWGRFTSLQLFGLLAWLEPWIAPLQDLPSSGWRDVTWRDLTWPDGTWDPHDVCQVAPPVVATVATVPPTVPGVATPIVRSVSIPGHVTPTPMAGYPTERWSSSVPNNVSQLASVASAVRASVGGREILEAKQG